MSDDTQQGLIFALALIAVIGGIIVGANGCERTKTERFDICLKAGVEPIKCKEIVAP